MRLRVLLTDAIHEDAVTVLREAGDISLVYASGADAARDMVPGASAIIARSQLPDDLLEFATRDLRVIARHGIGLDFVPLQEATKRRIPVVFAPTSSTQTVAEHTLAVMLQLSRHTCQLDQSVRADNWGARDQYYGRELYGKTLGVVGYGNIGKQVASMCRAAFHMRVAVFSRTTRAHEHPALDDVDHYTDLGEVLERADYVSLHVPLTEETRGLIGANELAQMKRSAFLINVSRGAVVDEAALAIAIMRGQISGAALDVFAQQPLPKSSPLRSLDNVVLTPHSASLTLESFRRTGTTVATDIVRVLSNQRPHHLANPSIYDETDPKGG